MSDRSIECGVLISEPLLYRAARASAYGKRCEYEDGSISDAMFVYLDGATSGESVNAVDMLYRGRPLVCMTAAWEAYIREHHPEAIAFERHMMKPLRRFARGEHAVLPEGYRLAAFDEKAFKLHPFSHGENYSSYDEFGRNGAGAVVWHGGDVVASASSFISFNGEVELDISTDEEHRGRGLATACAAMMLADCERRGIYVHWDAQNDISLHLAEKFGFETECRYNVYFLPGKK